MKNKFYLRSLILLVFLFVIFLSAGCSRKKNADLFCAAGSEEFSTLMDYASYVLEKEAKIKFYYEGRGNHTGPVALRDSICQVAAMTVPMSDSEMDALIKKGKKPIVFAVAAEALAIIVPVKDQRKEISFEELEKLYGKQGGVYGVNSASERYRFFKDSVLKGKNYSDKVIEVPGPLELVDRVSKSEHAAGYVRPAEATDKVKILPVRYKDLLIFPDEASVTTGKYPVSRYYYIYITEINEKNKILIELLLSDHFQKKLLSWGLFSLPVEKRNVFQK